MCEEVVQHVSVFQSELIDQHVVQHDTISPIRGHCQPIGRDSIHMAGVNIASPA